jgi:hypothetical protein
MKEKAGMSVRIEELVTNRRWDLLRRMLNMALAEGQNPQIESCKEDDGNLVIEIAFKKDDKTALVEAGDKMAETIENFNQERPDSDLAAWTDALGQMLAVLDEWNKLREKTRD